MSDPVLAIIWYGIICMELGLYILLDGGNLGIGIVSLLPQKEEGRSLMMEVISPIWNANETWLLVAAGTLFGAFPLVYSTGLNALYIPGVVILIGLIGRAVSFEFHVYSDDKEWWMRLFGLSSLTVAVGHGFILGGILSGISITDGHFSGTAWDWATPLTVLITVGIILSYLVLGYAYLIRRIDYANSRQTFNNILLTVGGTFIVLLGATYFLPKTNYLFFQRWMTAPTMYLLFADAACIALLSFLLVYDLFHKRHADHIYFYCLAIFAFGAFGMIIGTYPYLIPPTVSIFDAASPSNTLRFMLFGLGPIIPIILAYNWYVSFVFRRGDNVNETY